jgi:hydroxymethylglutaryl-CoA lyase
MARMAAARTVTPERVTVYEVGPRDGLQNETTPVPSAVKIELIERLAGAGLPAVETTSFVSPKWIPQLADATEVMAGLSRREGVRYPVLVPNQAGLERALQAGASEVAIFGSATETFARKNLNRSIDESLEMFAPVVQGARAAGLRVRGYLSMVLGDPWEGTVPPAQVVGVARRMYALGVHELSLGDTIGVGTPAHVRRLLTALADEVPVEALAVHYHDTYGQALANVLTSLELGVRTVDAAVGGLGGCPYAESATGNLATEDLVYMLGGLEIETGVDLDALVDAAWWISGCLGREPVSRVARALGAPAQGGQREYVPAPRGTLGANGG